MKRDAKAYISIRVNVCGLNRESQKVIINDYYSWYENMGKIYILCLMFPIITFLYGSTTSMHLKILYKQVKEPQ